MPVAIASLSRRENGKPSEGKLVRGIRYWALALTVGLLVLLSFRAMAHTLPISYLFVVADKDYVHLELSFNPFELSSFAEYDTNHDARLDAAELAAVEPQLCRKLLDHLTLRVNDEVVATETAGLSPEGDTHHATLRAHYRVDARHAMLVVSSSLAEITSSSHLTQLNFLRDGKRELAQLDAQSHTASFLTTNAVTCDPNLPGICPTCAPSSGRDELLAMSVGFGVVLLLGLYRARRMTRQKSSSITAPTSHPL